ncbi:AI-2E family transporter [Shewanella marinintestina]|uniref:AI-2E family transporter n=1 Tax=Shewanella marinintestina TaxID=190305 RepID=UPI00200DAFBB|nr:AI-2E family transporter [Shewanella marinintestina]MCL1145944.1 AI-2E family transporter [Shewanella marinintestina]
MDSFKLKPRHAILLLALAIACYACYLLVSPYLGAIVLAFIVAILVMPFHIRVQQHLPNSPNMASVVSCTSVTVMVLIPLLFVAIAIMNEGINFMGNAYQWLTDGGAKDFLAHPYIQSGVSLLNKWLPFDTIKIDEVVQQAAVKVTQLSSSFLTASTGLLGDVADTVLSFSLMLFVLFFFLRDQEKIIAGVRHIIPLSRSQEELLFDEVKMVAKSAVFGAFLTALAQGALGGIAMAMAGFSGLFWGSMMAFASFIPFVGTAMIWLPASIYLFITGDWQWALFLMAWGILVIGSIDNFLRPWLMQGNTGMSTLLLFFSLLGGLQLFGLIGLIYGPIIFAVTLVLARLYEIEFQDFIEQQDKT